MRFGIRWSRRALDAVAQFWIDDAAHRAEINEATKVIDRSLAVEPSQQGESRDEGRRLMFVPPLVVTFSIDDKHHVVQILNVRFMKPRK